MQDNRGEYALNSKKFLLNSIYELLQKNSLEKITVEMILEDSGVSRATFYRYFRDKYELMNWYYKVNIDKLTINIKELPWKDALIEILEFLKSNRDYFKNAIKVEGPDSFIQFLYQYSFDFYEREYLKHIGRESLNIEAKICIEFLSSGHVFVLKKWLERGCQVPPKDMAEILFLLIPENIRLCFE